jgi:hypothetical protein
LQAVAIIGDSSPLSKVAGEMATWHIAVWPLGAYGRLRGIRT